MPEDEKEKPEEKQAIAKLTNFLTNPHGITDETKERVDTQADLSSNPIAEGIAYHRTLADRFRNFKGEVRGVLWNTWYMPTLRGLNRKPHRRTPQILGKIFNLKVLPWLIIGLALLVHFLSG